MLLCYLYKGGMLGVYAASVGVGSYALCSSQEQMAALWFSWFKFGVGNLPAAYARESVGADDVSRH